jgi:hypothetical protein
VGFGFLPAVISSAWCMDCVVKFNHQRKRGITMGVARRFNKAKKEDGSQYLDMGIGLGIAIGAGIGAAINNIAIGIGCGLALGIGLGSSLMARKTKRASRKTRTHLPAPNP